MITKEMNKEVEHRINPDGSIIDPSNGRCVAIMIPIYGEIRSTCRECKNPIVSVKSGGWMHSEGRLMMHVPRP